jgi:hypothetical protein
MINQPPEPSVLKPVIERPLGTGRMRRETAHEHASSQISCAIDLCSRILTRN